MLRENNAIGMSSSQEPIHWNLHQAIAALTDGLAELIAKNEKIERRVDLLESKLRNMR